MSGNESILQVFLGNNVIAHLSLQQDQLIWTYTANSQSQGFPVSPHLSLSNDIPAINTNRFLRNMLPEGDAFDELIQNAHVTRSNIFALIRTLGLDTPGALVLTQSGIPEKGYLRELTEEELVKRLDNRDKQSLVIWDNKPRLSVAGLQAKINLVVNSKGQFGFGEGSLCSTHILKFEKKNQTHLVLNEYLALQLAKKCGLNVASASLKKYGKHLGLLVERFDRKLINDNEVKRRHIIDGCQALNLPPDYKYERPFGNGRDVAHIRDGVSLPLLFNFANQCQNPALTKQQILDWVLFNILINNFDAHGKNISFFIGEQGISLSPFYDLVNIRMYPDLEQELAMAIGDEFDSSSINAFQIASFAESCQLSRSYVAKRLKQIIDKLILAIPQEMDKIKNEVDDSSWFIEYQKTITKNCEHLLEQYPEIPRIEL